jgi:hypothetical protein
VEHATGPQAHDLDIKSWRKRSGFVNIACGERQILWTYGAVMMDDATPRQLWLAQGQITRWISGFYGRLGNLGMTVGNSIARMWLARIARNGYLFRLPQYAIRKIEEAAAESHLGKILLAVAARSR